MFRWKADRISTKWSRTKVTNPCEPETRILHEVPKSGGDPNSLFNFVWRHKNRDSVSFLDCVHTNVYKETSGTYERFLYKWCHHFFDGIIIHHLTPHPFRWSDPSPSHIRFLEMGSAFHSMIYTSYIYIYTRSAWSDPKSILKRLPREASWGDLKEVSIFATLLDVETKNAKLQ